VNCETGKPDQGNVIDREELFQLLVESAIDFAIFTTDGDGLVTSWNGGGEHLMGYAEDEIVGQSADVIFSAEDRAAGKPTAERTQALREGRAQDERWHLRKDGSRFWGSGLMMPLHGGNGFVKIMRDRTAHWLAETQLAESEERFRTLAVNIPALVFRTWPDGSRTWGSPQWEVYTGLTDEQSHGSGWLEAVHPDDCDATAEAWRDAVQSGFYRVEHRLRRRLDGQYRWHQTRASPMSEKTCATREWVGASTDIHELRSLQSRQEVLLAELQHRTRNLLALVQAIARRTIRKARSLTRFADEYEGRLGALSRVQSLVASTAKCVINLRPLIEAELLAHGADLSRRIRIEGPEITIPSGAAQTLALAFHELATNAVKYGALGQPAAQLMVTWRIEQTGDGCRCLTLEWLESGVVMPEISAPRPKGYGSELIERALPYQLGAGTTLEFMKSGVHCVISVPLDVPKPHP